MVVEAGYLPSEATRPSGKVEMYGAGRRTRRTAWQRRTGMEGIGPLRKGQLVSLGYHATQPMTTRRKALSVAVRKYGALSTFRKLGAVSTYSKKHKTTARTFRRDRNWVRKTFLSHKSK